MGNLAPSSPYSHDNTDFSSPSERISFGKAASNPSTARSPAAAASATSSGRNAAGQDLDSFKNLHFGRKSSEFDSIELQGGGSSGGITSVELQADLFDMVPLFFIEHLVNHKDRETLLSIALRYHVHENELHKANEQSLGSLGLVGWGSFMGPQFDLSHVTILLIPCQSSAAASQSSHGADACTHCDFLKQQHTVLSKRYASGDISILENRLANTAKRRKESQRQENGDDVDPLMPVTYSTTQSSISSSTDGAVSTYEDEFVYCCQEYIELKQHYWPGPSDQSQVTKYNRRIPVRDVLNVQLQVPLHSLRGRFVIGSSVFEQRFCHSESLYSDGIVLYVSNGRGAAVGNSGIAVATQPPIFFFTNNLPRLQSVLTNILGEDRVNAALSPRISSMSSPRTRRRDQDHQQDK